MYAPAGVSFCWSHIPPCWKSHVVSQITSSYSVLFYPIVTIDNKAANVGEVSSNPFLNSVTKPFSLFLMNLRRLQRLN